MKNTIFTILLGVIFIASCRPKDVEEGDYQLTYVVHYPSEPDTVSVLVTKVTHKAFIWTGRGSNGIRVPTYNSFVNRYEFSSNAPIQIISFTKR